MHDSFGGLGRAALTFAILGAAAPAEPPSTVTTYEAEDQATSGRMVDPSFTFGTLAAEASGRRAISLDSARETLDFIARAAGRGLTIRYSLPDSEDGRGLESTAVVAIDGVDVVKVPLTSRYSYFYGAWIFERDGGAIIEYLSEKKVCRLGCIHKRFLGRISQQDINEFLSDLLHGGLITATERADV